MLDDMEYFEEITEKYDQEEKDWIPPPFLIDINSKTFSILRDLKRFNPRAKRAAWLTEELDRRKTG